MAAISMQGRKQDGDLTAFVEAFGGTNRYILDYLMEEVLNQQTPAIQDFLDRDLHPGADVRGLV